MPDSGEVKIFRKLSSVLPCDKYDPDDPPRGDRNGGTGNWCDDYWVVGQGRILDQTEFVTQLVKASNGVVIGALDSVGVDQNPNSILAQRYGTEPDVMNIERNIPQGYGGEEVFIRVSPRRYGPTPYGMTLAIIPSMHSWAGITEYTPDMRETVCDSSFINSIDSCFFARVLTYADSLEAMGMGGCQLSGIYLTDEQVSIFNDRYYDGYFINEVGDKVYYAWADTSQAKRSVDNDMHTFSKLNPQRIKIVSISPMPVPGYFAEATIRSYYDYNNCTMQIYSLDGTKLEDLWKGNIEKGENRIKLDLKNIEQGTYMVVMKDKNYTMLANTKFVITR